MVQPWCHPAVRPQSVQAAFGAFDKTGTRTKKKRNKTKHKKQFDWLDDIHVLKRQMKLKWNKIKALGFSLWALNWGNLQFQSARPFLVALVSSTQNASLFLDPCHPCRMRLAHVLHPSGLCSSWGLEMVAKRVPRGNAIHGDKCATGAQHTRPQSPPRGVRLEFYL